MEKNCLYLWPDYISELEVKRCISKIKVEQNLCCLNPDTSGRFTINYQPSITFDCEHKISTSQPHSDPCKAHVCTCVCVSVGEHTYTASTSHQSLWGARERILISLQRLLALPCNKSACSGTITPKSGQSQTAHAHSYMRKGRGLRGHSGCCYPAPAEGP